MVLEHGLEGNCRTCSQRNFKKIVEASSVIGQHDNCKAIILFV